MSSVYLCSKTNSTLFTTCCHAAINRDEKNCPVCKDEVWPDSYEARWDVGMRSIYSEKALSEIRKGTPR